MVRNQNREVARHDCAGEPAPCQRYACLCRCRRTIECGTPRRCLSAQPRNVAAVRAAPRTFRRSRQQQPPRRRQFAARRSAAAASRRYGATRCTKSTPKNPSVHVEPTSNSLALNAAQKNERYVVAGRLYAPAAGVNRTIQNIYAMARHVHGCSHAAAGTPAASVIT